MKRCKICGKSTDVIFNINFNAVHICTGCSKDIFIQEAQWYYKQQNISAPLKRVIPKIKKTDLTNVL